MTGTGTGPPEVATGVDADAAAEVDADVCVVGGGPAGAALALALVRLGLRTALLERAPDGLRPFRGESLSPDAVWHLDRLGVLDRLAPEALTVRGLEVADAGRTVLSVPFADFPHAHRFPLELPQPRLLAVLAEAAAEHPGFLPLPRWTVTGLLREGGRTVGVRAATPGGEGLVRARLTAAADGRHSPTRRLAGLPAATTPLRRDVLWLRLPQVWSEPAYRIRIRGDRHAVLLPDSGGTVRVGFNLPKGGLRELRAQGVAALLERLDQLAPELSGVAGQQIGDWSDTALLDIFSTVVPTWWQPGLVLLGDAAHTLSPVLGQGVHHALADAAALAPLAAAALHDGGPAALDAALAGYQRRRQPAVARSRALQARQERLFTWASPPAAALRRTVYRALDAAAPLRRRVLEPVYFADQLSAQEEDQP
ncbi:FAD-dependent oxidoreductase [Streptacidiphilus sp. PB12-B1b]|uniref:FAD-dependent monooxygenase n=1 Tax=Streptacidiphilus sp. PB12-B1b TaxID=2705012 RepID=UPI0015FD2487|nr:FAD-dependent monooxygenase [Streptacidiphilus sp. PB12-B1b]QMU78136.1 FAD-dependent oxidoreductase [Streptacidiphilus sp. PB12-B1b]